MLYEEELRTIIENLTVRELIEPALNNWIKNQSTGKTVINIETGKVEGISIKMNEIADFDHNTNHIELYKIGFDEDLFDDEDLLNDEEYDKYQEFKLEKEDDYDSYDPEIFNEFCKLEKIDEKERRIKILIEDYENYHFRNFETIEHSIILNYHDEEEKF